MNMLAKLLYAIYTFSMMFKHHTTKTPIIVWIWILLYMYRAYTKYISIPTYMEILWHMWLGTHEVWHIIFGIFWHQFIWVAWWTIMQLMVAILFIYAFARQKEFLGVAAWLWYLWINFFYISMYAGDAMKLQLPLLSFSWDIESSIHDRNYMLFELGVLEHTDQIAYGFHMIWVVLMRLCFFYWSRVLLNSYLMRTHPHRKEMME